MNSTQAPQRLIYNISRRAKEMLKQRGVTKLADIFPRFGPAGFMAQFPSFPRNDFFGLYAILVENFRKQNVQKRGWTKGEIRRVLGESTNGDFPTGTDQGVINRFIHSATTGKHYKKPRWRRRL